MVAHGLVQFDSTKTCHYCKGRGHWKGDCPKHRNSGAQVKSAAIATSDQGVSPVISSSQQHCGLVQGEVAMGVRPALPLKGVDVILGNDLAGRDHYQ